MLNDQQLLELARSGQPGALEELLERHQSQIYRFGMGMCRDAEDAKDVLQDTLLSVARNVKDFRGASSISTWLYSIARSFCVKKRRKSKFAPKEAAPLAGEADRVADPGVLADEALSSKEVEQALHAAISSLEPMYREVLLLRDVEGLTALEVAQVTGASVQAVKSRLHRARLALREQIAPLLGVPSSAPAASAACPDVLSLFSAHLEDQVSAEVCAEMERHLAACPRCRGACDSLERTLALCRAAVPGVPVPSSVQAAVKLALKDFLAVRSS